MPPSADASGVPGGNKAPFGIIREGKPSILRIDEERAPIVIRAYQLAATGSTDWEVAAQTGLAKTHVGELLTNPIYAGRLRTGEVAAIAPIIDPGALVDGADDARAPRTRTPGRIVKGQYALRLRCSGCGRYLYGDVGRYRHPPPTCETFLAATADGPPALSVTGRCDTPHQGPQLPEGLVRGRHR